MEPSVYISLDKSYKLKKGPDKGKFHAKVWVTFIRWEGQKKVWDQRPYKTGVFVTQKEFDSLMENDPKKKTRIERLKDLRKELDAAKTRAELVIKTYNITTEAKFNQYFLSDQKPESLSGQFQFKIDELKKAKKFSSAEKYETAIASFKAFFGENVSFHSCTPDRLRDYEEWYISQNKDKNGKKGKKSLTSVGINMRCLRHIFKRAIRAGIIPVTLYPFGVGQDLYIIPEGGEDDTKAYLDLSDREAFINYRCVNECYDYAIFCYYAQGLNFSDIARLAWSELKDGYISKTRQKTKGRQKKSKKLIIPIHPRMQEIIQRRGNKSLDPNGYVFPILTKDMDEEAIFYRIRQFVKDTNEVLAAIAKDLKLSIVPTTYTLRHTFSFRLMELGATTEELQDALGHGSIKTTESYKHGFTLEKKKKYSEGL